MADNGTTHKPSRDLLDLALDHGWSAKYEYGADTGGAPFVAVEAVRDDVRVGVTWHTRDTGTYRLFSTLVRPPSAARGNSLKAITAVLTSAVEDGDG